MTDLLAAAKRLGEARRGRAQTWLLSRYDAKTDNYSTAVADEQWALEISLAEAEYEIAKWYMGQPPRWAAGYEPDWVRDLYARESEDSDSTQPARPSAHAHAESDHCDQTY